MMKKLLITSLLLISTNLVFAADQWTPTKPLSADAPSSWPTDEQANNNSISRILGNYRQGEVLVYSSTSAISVTAGEITTNSTTPYIFRQNTASTNVTTANLDTGASFASSSTYYVYAVADTNATTNTIMVSLNSSTPSGATNYRRLGSFTTDSAASIAAVINDNYTGLGSRVSKSSGVVYLATTDGFVIDVFVFSTNSSSVYSKIDSDGSPTPSTTIAKTFDTNSSNGGGTHVVPIKKGDYWEVGDNGSCSHTTYWQPMGV